MSRKKKTFREFETNKNKDGFVRLTYTLLNSNSYKNLKYYSIKLYIHMLQWAKGKLEFEYSLSLAEKILPSSTAQKAFKELIKYGFIEVVRKGCFANRTATVYKFSDKWQKM